VLLLAASFFISVWPRPFGLRLNTHGIPVKDRIIQAGEFVLCAFGALYLAFDFFREGRRMLALGLTLLAGAFLINILYVAASRTSLVVIPFLLVLWGIRRFGWKGTAALVAIGGVFGAVVWMSSP
jgi:O-antigen ligase